MVPDRWLPLPMTAVRTFYLETAVNTRSTCHDLLSGGVYVQSPDGQKVALQVNGTNIVMGSSAIFRAEPNGGMLIAVLEGQLDVTVGSIHKIIKPGQELNVQLGGFNGLSASGFNGDPVTLSSYELSALELPTVCQAAQAAGLGTQCGDVLLQTPTPEPSDTPLPGIVLLPTQASASTLTPTATNTLPPPPPPPPPGKPSITATGGTPQTGQMGTPFAGLQATVKDQNNNPMAGVTVTFTAPANATFPGPSATATPARNVQGT